jgi:drug/metabolite transporter (DMT)-like permease
VDARRGPISRRDWLGIVGLGFLGYYLASLLDFVGLQYVSAGVGRLIMFLYPTLVIILSAVFLKKHPTARELAALAITYTGIALVLSSQSPRRPKAACSCLARCSFSPRRCATPCTS